MPRQLWAILLLLSCIFICGIQCNKKIFVEKPVCVKGVIDLQNWNFDHDGVIPLMGEWELYWDKLLTPNDFSKKNIPSSISYLRVQKNWNSNILDINEKKIEFHKYVTCKLKIILPSKHKKMGVYFSWSRKLPTKIWINGSDVTADFEKSRYWYDRYFDCLQDTCEIICHFKEFKDVHGDIKKNLNVASYITARNFIDDDLKVDFFVAGALIIMAIYNFLFYLLHRKSKQTLYLGLVCVCITCEVHFPFSHVFMLTFAYIKIFFYGLFLRSLLPHNNSIVLEYIFYLTCILIVIVSIPVHGWVDVLRHYFNAVIILYWLYVSYAILDDFIRKKSFANIQIIIFIIIVPLTYFILVLFNFQYIQKTNIISFLINNLNTLIFLFCQSLFLASQFAKASKAAEAMNERLLKVDKLKDEFLANTSHELRTPIAGMVGIAQLLLDDKQHSVSSRQADSLQMIISSGKRLSNIINDILDFSKIRNNDLSLHIRPVELRNIVDVVLDLCRPMIGNKKVVLRNLITLSLPAVNADENRLQQILYNLIGNAVKFTYEGDITISALYENQHIAVSVSDTGIGIASEHIDSLFIPFSQEKRVKNAGYGGTGLGLSITKHLVELMGGSISVESRPNKGSVFTFTLPLAFEQVEQEKMTIPSIPQSVNDGDRLVEETIPMQIGSVNIHDRAIEPQIKKTVLVVDDEPVNLFYIENQLIQDGFTVLTAQDGESALQILQQQKPDAILLDLMMPRMSGFEICRCIRETYHISVLPVIIITAMNQPLDLVTALKAGANDYITKFCTKEELLARLNTHIQIVDAIQKVREIEAEIVRAGQLECTGELAAGVAHEVLTPITTIMLNAQNLLESGSIGDDEVEYSKMIYQEANRIDSIVKSLLTFARIGKEEKKANSIHEIVKQTMALIKTQTKKEGIRFELQIADGLPEIHLDFSKMQQVFMNLFSNSRYAIRNKYGSTGRAEGIIRLSAVIQNHEPHFIQIKFEDNGCGISRRNLNKVMNPFFTTKPAGQGTGLGLSICHGIVTDHGGTFEVESIEHEYTRIIIKLPILIKEN